MRIALTAAAVLALAAFALWHPAPRAAVQSVSSATPNAGPYPLSSGRELHRHLRHGTGADDLVVYVAGAVRKPGLYHLHLGDRYAQAVALAGGFGASAEPGGVNLAQRAADGEEVYVPAAGEAPRTRLREPRARRHRASPPPDGSVDVNTSDAATLAAVPGIGRAVGARIVELREREGSFASLDELLDVAGMTQSRLERARPYLRDP
ncbi:MAG TPA: ComEA family DNA-binding protein [Candidatus Cybelea sp.]|nr:ComEA family DNA-binding protein [Candidatus Cybelea sp.]